MGSRNFQLGIYYIKTEVVPKARPMILLSLTRLGPLAILQPLWCFRIHRAVHLDQLDAHNILYISQTRDISSDPPRHPFHHTLPPRPTPQCSGSHPTPTQSKVMTYHCIPCCHYRSGRSSQVRHQQRTICFRWCGSTNIRLFGKLRLYQTKLEDSSSALWHAPCLVKNDWNIRHPSNGV